MINKWGNLDGTMILIPAAQTTPENSHKQHQTASQALQKTLLVRVSFVVIDRAHTGQRRIKTPDGEKMKNVINLEEKGQGLGLMWNRKETDLLGSDSHPQTYGFAFYMSCGFSGWFMGS